MSKVMGIDYGTKKVGIALSDEGRAFAFPKCVLPNDDELIAKIVSIDEEEDVDLIVLGESTNYDGHDNPVMEEARAFAEALAKAGFIDIVFEPEVLTSALAKRQFESKEKTRKPKKQAVVDDSAAAIILQSYLDSVSNSNDNS